MRVRVSVSAVRVRRVRASRGAKVLSCIPEYVRLLRTVYFPPSVPSTACRHRRLIVLLPLFVLGEEHALRRTRETFIVLSSQLREEHGARARVSRRELSHGMNFTSRSRVKRGRGRRRITGRDEKAGGSPNSLLQPRGTDRASSLASDQKTSPARTAIAERRATRGPTAAR